MYKALIVDDHPVIRLAVKVLLEREGYEVVGEAGNGVDAVQMTRELEPDLLILDIGLPKLDGLEVIGRLHAMRQSLKILVLTSQSPSFFSHRCMQAGAAGYMYKAEDLNELSSAVRAIMKGYNYFPSLSFNSVRAADTEATEADLLSRLSDRELSVLQQLARGLSNKDIGEMLMLSNKTISTHKTNILDKLNLQSVIELAELAKRHSLI
ncbi:response regulator [Pseudomonas sp. 22526]|uniref:response regulator n=1 Tax=Pseudomonas sp. 22526 TaxID=3453937 RepID=UPI003F8484EC